MNQLVNVVRQQLAKAPGTDLLVPKVRYKRMRGMLDYYERANTMWLLVGPTEQERAQGLDPLQWAVPLDHMTIKHKRDNYNRDYTRFGDGYSRYIEQRLPPDLHFSISADYETFRFFHEWSDRVIGSYGRDCMRPVLVVMRHADGSVTQVRSLHSFPLAWSCEYPLLGYRDPNEEPKMRADFTVGVSSDLWWMAAREKLMLPSQQRAVQYTTSPYLEVEYEANE